MAMVKSLVFCSSRSRHTRFDCDWSSDVCSSDLGKPRNSLTGSATYAIKEFLGLPGSLASTPQQRPTFYIILTLATVAGVAMNFMHLDPIRALFLAAVINGVVAPPLLLLIVLLGRDPAVMKRYVSGPLSLVLTAIATVFMALAAIAMFATIFTGG